MRNGLVPALAFILLTAAEPVSVAQTSSPACHSPQQLKRVAELLFGRNIGGKPGVSDTMAAALWGLDFMFTLAQFNAAGVNMETGVNHLGFLSYYTPIGVDSARRFIATPLYYGMLAFRLASDGERVKLALDPAGLNITAYAVRSDRGDIWLTLVNKEGGRDASVRVSCPGVAKADVIRLTAPSLSSKDGVLLGGTQVSMFGKWAPGAAEPVRVKSGEMEIAVPAASAAIVRLH